MKIHLWYHNRKIALSVGIICTFIAIILSSTDTLSWQRRYRLLWKIKLFNPSIQGYQKIALPGIVQTERGLVVTVPDTIYLIDPSDGHIIWNRPLASFCYSTPLVKDDRIYVHCADGILKVLLLDSGRIEKKTRTDFVSTGDILSFKDRLILTPEDGGLSAYDPVNLKELWRIEGRPTDYDPTIPYPAPIPVSEFLFQATKDGKLLLVDPEDGELRDYVDLCSGEVSGIVDTEEGLLATCSDRIAKVKYNLEVEWVKNMSTLSGTAVFYAGYIVVPVKNGLSLLTPDGTPIESIFVDELDGAYSFSFYGTKVAILDLPDSIYVVDFLLKRAVFHLNPIAGVGYPDRGFTAPPLVTKYGIFVITNSGYLYRYIMSEDLIIPWKL